MRDYFLTSPFLSSDDIFIVGPLCQCSLEQVVKGNGLVTVGAFKRLATHICRETHLGQMLDLIVHGDFTCVVLGPLGSFPVECLKVTLEHLGHHCILWIICANGKRAPSAHIIVVRNESEGQLLTRLRGA